MRSHVPLCVALAVLAGACRRAEPPAPRFPALVPEWAEPTPFSYHARVSCDVPDGGATVAIVPHAHAWLSGDGDCAISPLTCRSPAARVEVLRALDAGTLVFPALRRVQTDARGWFRAELDDDAFFRVECGPAVGDYRADRPTPAHTWNFLLSISRPDFPTGRERVFLVNPFTRQSQWVSAAEWAEAPPSLLEGAWLTDESGFVRLPGERSTVEREEEAAVDGGLLAVRVEAPQGVRRARLKLTLEQDGGEPLWLDTSANGADWPVPPGDWQLTVAMAGAETVTRPVTVGAARTEVLVPLVAASGARGRVLDEGGRPVEGACIDVQEGEQRALCVARSDLRGEFALAPPTGPRRLRASHPSHGMSLEQVATGPEPVTLRLAVRSRLILEVRAPDGALAVADVEVSPGAEGRTVRVLTREAPVELTNLDPGPQHVRVTAQDRFAPPLSLTMPERGELRRELRLEPLVSVEGVVVRNGVPVRGVPLWNEAVLGVESDAQGRFRFDRLPPRPFELRIGFQGKRVWLPAPGRFEINLATGAVRTLPQ